MYSLPSHRGSDVIEAEFAEMCSQIQLERNKKTMTNFYNLWTRKYIRRTLLACLTVNMMKLSGSNVIQNYRSIMYNSNCRFFSTSGCLLTFKGKCKTS